MTSVFASHADELVFTTLNAHYSGQIEIIDVDTSQSDARAFHVRMPVSPDLSFKVERTIRVVRQDAETTAFYTSESLLNHSFKTRMEISHVNLVSLHAFGKLSFNNSLDSFYFVLGSIRDAITLKQWLAKNFSRLPNTQVIDVLIQIANSLQAFHRAGIINCNLNLDSVLVDGQNNIKIAEIGFSSSTKHIPPVVILRTSSGLFPAKYKDFVRQSSEIDQFLIQMTSDLLDESLDYHYFGKIISRILELNESTRKFSTLDTRFLKLMAERMDLDITPQLPRYNSIEQIIADLLKLLPVQLSRSGVPELTAYAGTRTIRIPITGSIPFSARVESIISHPLFLRLYNSLQLGFTYYVFPGAAHTRFEHSLGVFANVARYITSLLSDDSQPYFRQVVDDEKIATTLLTGLVHDIGQNSFAHNLEDLGLIPRHEDVTSAFITGENIEEYVSDRFLHRGALDSVLQKYWPEVDIPRLLWIISGGGLSQLGSDIGWDIMRSIVNGPIDADKTDYLLRDAHHAGVEYARSIDVTRFMNSLTGAVITENAFTKGVLAITWKGAQSAENIILARSQMFWVLYWHHAVRSAHGTIGECCYEHLLNADKDTTRKFKQTLYSGTIGELLALLETSHSARARHLAALLRHRNLYKRGVDLDYRDDKRLYIYLTGLKDHCAANNDPLMRSVAYSFAEMANRRLARNLSSTRLTADDVMLDIPKATKDRLGAVYVVNRNSDQASEYSSRAMSGTSEDWQNRVRTIRVLLAPNIEKRDREVIRKHGRDILENL